MNSMSTISSEDLKQHQRIRNYYQFQSQIYDATRWAFLFGRKGILKLIPFEKNETFSIAEIGCGTGFNMQIIAKNYPQSKLLLVDVSKDMLDIATEKLSQFKNQKVVFNLPYDQNFSFQASPDIILCSYALTMINPQWKELIQKAYADLPKGGKIMVADFYDSNFGIFKAHMANHHVRMDGHLLPELKKLFKTKHESISKAYGGVWEYFMYVGEKE